MSELDRLAGKAVSKHSGMEPAPSWIIDAARRRRRRRRGVSAAVVGLLIGAGLVAVTQRGTGPQTVIATAGTTSTTGTPTSSTATTSTIAGTNQDPTETTSSSIQPETQFQCGLRSPLAISVETAGYGVPEPGVVGSDGVLVQRTPVGPGIEIEVRWPARDRVLYDLSHGPTLYYPLVDGPFSGDGEPSRVRMFDPFGTSLGPDFELTVEIGWVDVEGLGPRCSLAEVIRIEDGAETVKMGLDLSAQPGYFPIVDLSPMVTSTEAVAVAPFTAIGCDASDGEVPPTVSGPGDDLESATPVEALAAFLETESAETFIKTGYHEMIADDGSYTYGVFYELPPGGPSSTGQFVTLIRVEDIGAGWRATDWTASGC